MGDECQLFDIQNVNTAPRHITNHREMFCNWNCFNPSTTIRYAVPKSAKVVVKIYDVLGREVAELVNDRRSAGEYTIVWNAQNFASGIYYYRMTADDFVSVKKLILMK